jgi:hypothetical protein
MGPIVASVRAPAIISLRNFAQGSVSDPLEVPKGADFWIELVC